MGNPFLEESQDLLVIDTRVVMDAAVADSVRKVESLDEDQYKKFVEERLESCTKPITENIAQDQAASVQSDTGKDAVEAERTICCT